MPLSDQELELLDSWIALLKNTLEVRLLKRLIAEVRGLREGKAKAWTDISEGRVVRMSTTVYNEQVVDKIDALQTENADLRTQLAAIQRQLEAVVPVLDSILNRL